MKYTKTDAGQLAFKQRSPQITARQRSVFILFDGNKTLTQVLAATAGMGVTEADVQALVEVGFLALVQAKDSVAPAGGASSATPGTVAEVATAAPAANSPDAAARFLKAKMVATQLSASMGLKGFMLNMLIEEAENLRDLEQLLPKLRAGAGAKACEPLEALIKAA